MTGHAGVALGFRASAARAAIQALPLEPFDVFLAVKHGAADLEESRAATVRAVARDGGFGLAQRRARSRWVRWGRPEASKVCSDDMESSVQEWIHTGCGGLRQRRNRCRYRLERDYSNHYSDSGHPEFAPPAEPVMG